MQQKILDDEGYSKLNKKEYEMFDAEALRRKIALIEDQEVKDDSEDLPSEYSVKKSQKRISVLIIFY